MSPEAETSTDAPDGGGWLALTVLALLAGAASGFVASLFRLALDQSDRWRDAVIGWAHGRTLLGFLVVVAGAAGAAGVAAWLVRRFAPYAGGSGIPHVLLACSMAMLVPTVLRNAPIYDSLRERTVHAGRRT